MRRGEVAVWTLLLLNALLQAQEPLKPCQDLYENREFTPALHCALTRMDSGLVTTREDSLKDYELTAILYYMLEDFEKTNLYFDQILFMDQESRLDPASVPPEIMALFNNRRSALFGKAPDQDAWTLAPFGVGHFRMKKYHRAVLYSFVAAVSLGVNVRAYQARESMRNSDGSYNDPGRALNLYRVQLTSFYAGFLGTGLASFVDALLTR
jgi:hypothetical protein